MNMKWYFVVAAFQSISVTCWIDVASISHG